MTFSVSLFDRRGREQMGRPWQTLYMRGVLLILDPIPTRLADSPPGPARACCRVWSCLLAVEAGHGSLESFCGRGCVELVRGHGESSLVPAQPSEPLPPSSSPKHLLLSPQFRQVARDQLLGAAEKPSTCNCAFEMLTNYGRSLARIADR